MNGDASDESTGDSNEDGGDPTSDGTDADTSTSVTGPTASDADGFSRRTLLGAVGGAVTVGGVGGFGAGTLLNADDGDGERIPEEFAGRTGDTTTDISGTAGSNIPWVSDIELDGVDYKGDYNHGEVDDNLKRLDIDRDRDSTWDGLSVMNISGYALNVKVHSTGETTLVVLGEQQVLYLGRSDEQFEIDILGGSGTVTFEAVSGMYGGELWFSGILIDPKLEAMCCI